MKKNTKIYIMVCMIIMIMLFTSACSENNDCGMCSGSGYYDKKTCPACNGSGNSNYDPYEAYKDTFN